MANKRFEPGQRVKIHPASDFFMMGERYGSVRSEGRKWIVVEGERSGRTYKFSVRTDNLEAC